MSGALFADDGVDELRQLFAIYTERNANQPQPPVFWSPDDINSVQQQEPTALRSLLEAIWHTWREHGGKGHGGRWDADPEKHGAFIRLLQELFNQAGKKPPSARTLRRALQAVREEDARLRENAAWVTDPDNVKMTHTPTVERVLRKFFHRKKT